MPLTRLYLCHVLSLLLENSPEVQACCVKMGAEWRGTDDQEVWRLREGGTRVLQKILSSDVHVCFCHTLPCSSRDLSRASQE